MRSAHQIRADLDVLASRDWLSKGDEGIVHRLAADVGPLLDQVDTLAKTVVDLAALCEALAGAK